MANVPLTQRLLPRCEEATSVDVFLEEDVDAGRFIAAWERSRGKWDVRNIDDGYNSAIRSYERITPTRQFDDNDILF